MIETERLKLRPFMESDAEDMSNLKGRLKAFLSSYYQYIQFSNLLIYYSIVFSTGFWL